MTPLINFSTDFYTTSFRVMKGKKLENNSICTNNYSPEYFKACNDRQKNVSSFEDIIICYPLEFTKPEWRNDKFFQNFVEIISELGGKISYEGIDKLFCYNNTFENQKKKIEGYITSMEKCTETNCKGITFYDPEHLKNTLEREKANPLLPKQKVKILFKEGFKSLKPLTRDEFVYFRVSAGTRGMISYYSSILVRFLFTGHYQPLVEAMFEVKKACPDYSWLDCLQIGFYSFEQPYLDEYKNIFTDQRGYFYYYGLCSFGNANQIAYKRITKQQLEDIFNGKATYYKSVQINMGSAMNSTFCSAALSLESGSYSTLIELYKNKKFTEIYDITKQ